MIEKNIYFQWDFGSADIKNVSGVAVYLAVSETFLLTDYTLCCPLLLFYPLKCPGVRRKDKR